MKHCLLVDGVSRSQTPTSPPAGATNAELEKFIGERLFRSSSGEVAAAYTARFDASQSSAAARWVESLLLNGFVEVKNLVSWPCGLFEPGHGDNLARIPAARARGKTLPPLSHVRHTARLLFDQHVVPLEKFEPPDVAGSKSGKKAPPPLPLLLKMKQKEVWSTQAVVEHQFVAVEFVPGAKTPALQSVGRDCRITIPQEVRFCSPSAFCEMLSELDDRMASNVRFALEGDTIHEHSPNFQMRALPEVARGYLSRPIMRMLTESPETLIDLADDAVMLVEASAPAMVRNVPSAGHTPDAIGAFPSNLLYLPLGTVQAFLAVLADYQSIESPDGTHAAWNLLSLPFLGRLQADEHDDFSFTPPKSVKGKQPPSLAIDPVLQILRGQPSRFDELSRLALSLANWEDDTPLTLAMAEFDLARHRFFSRLDPSSLRESWFRLSLPAPAQPPVRDVQNQAAILQSVLADPPTDEPGTLGRPESLASLLDPRRFSLPPDPLAPQIPPLPPTPSPIQWHPDSLFILDVAGTIAVDSNPASNGREAEYGFLGPGTQLEQTRLLPLSQTVVRYPAALVLPARLSLPPRFANVQPVSSAVSPYLGFNLDPATTNGSGKIAIAVSELVCFDVARSAAASIAARSWDPLTNPGALDPQILDWAAQTQRRFAADSPVAVVRLREIRARSDNSAASGTRPPGVDVAYRFLGITLPEVTPLSRRAIALRAAPAALRSAEGQYGGAIMPPSSLAPFELAPPQLNGVQPIRLDNRTDSSGAPRWPWGLSALRISTRQADSSSGIAGPAYPIDNDAKASADFGRIWWQSLQHNVQYAVPETDSIREVLPTLFRDCGDSVPLTCLAIHPPSRPGRSRARARLPGQRLHRRQPASGADANQCIPAGLARRASHHSRGRAPGAPFAFRAFIQTQEFTAEASQDIERPYRSVASGAVPVMHRIPRPVLLPPNRNTLPEISLQTWASAFVVTATVRASNRPIDTAYLENPIGPAKNDQSVRLGLDLELQALSNQATSPTESGGGEIPKGSSDADNWDFKLKFSAGIRGEGTSTVGDWTKGLVATLKDASSPPKTFTFNLSSSAADSFDLVPADQAGVADWLKTKAHGDTATVRLAVGIDPEPGAVKNFRQSLSFPLRINDKQHSSPLPLAPRFFYFEDPEYNRRLSSNTAQSSAVVVISKTSPAPTDVPVTFTLTLAADRSEYNTTGAIHYIFFLDPAPSSTLFDPTALKGDIEFKRIGPDGVSSSLHVVNDVGYNSLADSPGDRDLSGIDPKSTLIPGDTLLLSLTLKPPSTVAFSTKSIELGVSILATPVTPAPEAGYALLRKTTSADAPVPVVECARFAFSPASSRIELINPNDLHRQIVRRRAVFLWSDTVRRGRTVSYAIQKVTTGGSTHFPDSWVPDPPQIT